jgi:signal transduction histidine kinase
VTGTSTTGAPAAGASAAGAPAAGARMASAPVAGRDGEPPAWIGGTRRWDAYNLTILVITLVIIGTAGPARVRDRLLAGAVLLAMAGWYVLAGRRVLYGRGRDAASARRGAVYVAGLIVALALAELLSGTDTFILLALCPQCFMALPFRSAIAAVVALNATPVVIDLARHEPATSLGPAAGIAALGIAFSVAFGSWVSDIIDRSEERAALIEQLEATRAELGRAHREAGILAERQRLAVEIHDTIAQGFSSIVMLVQAAEAAIAADPVAARQHLALASATARENLAEARGMVAGLAPASLDGGGIDDALRRLATQTAAELGIEADLQIRGPGRELGTGAQVVLLRVCQEALSNVRKHAAASRAQIVLTYGRETMRLEVSDDGAGFDPAWVSGGFGLRGMRGRVAEAGGSLSVRSTPGAGATVIVEVPA